MVLEEILKGIMRSSHIPIPPVCRKRELGKQSHGCRLEIERGLFPVAIMWAVWRCSSEDSEGSYTEGFLRRSEKHHSMGHGQSPSIQGGLAALDNLNQTEHRSQ